jgi:hypothetical protein
LNDTLAVAGDVTISSTTGSSSTTTGSIQTAGGLGVAQNLHVGGTTTCGSTVTAVGDITAYYSDPRLKNFHGRIPDPIGKLRKLSGYYFTPNEVAQKLGFTDTRMQVGLNSAEVESVMPEIVRPAPIDATFNTIQYEKMVPLLIEVCKAQQRQIEALQKIAAFK